jgi:TPR repeat protein
MSMARWGAIWILAVLTVATARADEPTSSTHPPDSGYTAAMVRWRALAARGDADAALQLGLLYDTGRGVAQDFGAAEHWYRQAADAGSAAAAFNLGALYDSGRNGGRDGAAAYRWYRRAAERGFARAAYLLGVMTEAGDGTPADPTAAAKWYRLAVAGGVRAAAPRLAALGPVAQPQPQPSATSERQFASAVALWRAKGLSGGGDPALAALQAAARGGYPLAEYDLAYAYEHGIGLTPDVIQAYAWYGLVERSEGTAVLKSAATANRTRIGAKLSDDERAAAETAGTRLLSDAPSGPPAAR